MILLPRIPWVAIVDSQWSMVISHQNPQPPWMAQDQFLWSKNWCVVLIFPWKFLGQNLCCFWLVEPHLWWFVVQIDVNVVTIWPIYDIYGDDLDDLGMVYDYSNHITLNPNALKYFKVVELPNIGDLSTWGIWYKTCGRQAPAGLVLSWQIFRFWNEELEWKPLHQKILKEALVDGLWVFFFDYIQLQ